MNKAEALWKLGLREGFRVIRWTQDGNVDYDWAREISNSRFDLRPLAVAIPKTADHVSKCLTFCTQHEIPFRVRSGGHQHEGMSSLDDGVMIRLTELNQIEYQATDRAWIGVGKPLKEIYDELELKGKTIPGGGCWSVNVGGLTLGGGWGTSVRKMGLTCDNIEEVEIVTPNGDVVHAREDNDYQDLFWALRGGGGGNFGIVTRFLFKLSEIGPVVSSAFIQWEEPKEGSDEEKENYLTNIVRDYLQAQDKFPMELTTVMGVRVRHRFMKDYFPLGLSGKFYGTQEALQHILQPLLDRHPTPHIKFRHINYQRKEREAVPTNDIPLFGGTDPDTAPPQEDRHLLADLINEVADFPNLGAQSNAVHTSGSELQEGAYIQHPPPSTTCLAPWPHKISSGFLKGPEVYSSVARKVIKIIRKTPKEIPDDAARLYMVLHGMPGHRGGLDPCDTAFYWRGHDILLQFQAWWALPCLPSNDSKGLAAFQKHQDQYLCWIKQSRKELESDLVGAFINFIDRDLPLEAYYGGNIGRLRQIKGRYDPNNVFQFPMSLQSFDTHDLKRDAAKHHVPSGFRVVLRGERDYEEARQISNSRFDFKPLAIAFPRAAEHVTQCIRYCRDHNLQLRIRSGGHQHEGMCSAEDVLMVRLSEMNQIEYVDDPWLGDDETTAWIQVGARLEDVYKELAHYGRIIPGGGCKSVNVGGLTLGGGWGLSARKFGLASDNVLEVEVVLAPDADHPNGHIVKATRDNDHSDLFWALLGSGGGNFGIVTRFLFRLHKIQPRLAKYKMYWQTDHREQVIKRWLQFQREEEQPATTSYLVLYADLQDPHSEETVYAGGMSYNNVSDLKNELRAWIASTPPVRGPELSEFKPPTRTGEIELEGPVPGLEEAIPSLAIEDFVNYADFSISLPMALRGDNLTGGDSSESADACQGAEPPQDNCLGSHPHKVTSAFPLRAGEDFEASLATAIHDYLKQHPVDAYVKAYISLYSMGGAMKAIAPEASAFWYRDKAFVMQIEAWWSYPDTETGPCSCRDQRPWQQPYIDWVRRFRDALDKANLIEGAFINFVDKDLVPRNKSKKDRTQLLRHYYGKNLERLMASKKKWDPTNFFEFEMSIPLSAESPETRR